MSSRRRKYDSPRRGRDVETGRFDPYLDEPYKIITVSVPLPRSVARRARREVYPYPYPNQVRRRGRTIRRVLPHARLTVARVRIKVPKRLPLALPSYVSISRGRLNIHSRKQLGAALAAGELNRRRYDERKTNRRRARHGQLDSVGATSFGAVGAAAERSWSIDAIAEAALGARAINAQRQRLGSRRV